MEFIHANLSPYISPVDMAFTVKKTSGIRVDECPGYRAMGTCVYMISFLLYTRVRNTTAEWRLQVAGGSALLLTLGYHVLIDFKSPKHSKMNRENDPPTE